MSCVFTVFCTLVNPRVFYETMSGIKKVTVSGIKKVIRLKIHIHKKL